MLFRYIKRDVSIKFLLVIQVILIITLFFLNLVFSNYTEDYKSANRIRLGIINDDNEDKKSVLLIENFKSNDKFSELFEIVEGEGAKIIGDFKNSKLDAYVKIPKGFSDGLMHYENQTVSIFVDVKNPTKNMILSNIFRAYSNFIQGSNLATYSLYNTMEYFDMENEKLSNLNKSFSIEMVTTMLNRGQFFDTKTSSELPLVDAMRYFLYALPLAFVSFLSIEQGLNYRRARSTMILKREYLILNSRLKLMIYDILSKSVSMFLIFIPLFLAHIFIYDVLSAMLSALILFLAIVFFILLWRILSFFVRSDFGLSMIGSFGAFALCLVSGCIIPFIILPQSLKNLGVWMPNFFFLKLSMPDLAAGELLGGVAFLSAVILMQCMAEYHLLKREFA